MKTHYTILLSLFIVLSSCSNTFDSNLVDTSPKTDPRDAVIGTYQYQFSFTKNKSYFNGSYTLPTHQTIKVEKDPQNKSGIRISGIHNRFSVTLNGASGHFYQAFPNVKISDVSNFKGTIVGTPNQVTLIGSFSANGKLSYRVTLCGINILSTSALPTKKPEKSNLPN